MRRVGKAAILALAVAVVSVLASGCNCTTKGNTDSGSGDAVKETPKDHPAH